EELQRVIGKDDQVNKLADYCRRILNKGETKGIKHSHITYYIVEQLERIGDIYKKIAKYLLDNNLVLDSNNKVDFENVHKLLIMYRELFYDFNLEKMEEFGERFYELKSSLNNNNNNKLGLYQEFLLEHIFDMNGALLTARI
ncbi:MAG: hypothetical protein Q8Q35_00185, partial [Nanoarchaeota archaeon]|nr:hypothetical protein [Nanoarchaeota archaeon]